MDDRAYNVPQLYDRGKITTIKNVRNQYNCRLIYAKHLVETFCRENNIVDYYAWQDKVHPYLFDVWAELNHDRLFETFDQQEYELNSIRSALDVFNNKWSTDYTLYRH